MSPKTNKTIRNNILTCAEMINKVAKKNPEIRRVLKSFKIMMVFKKKMKLTGCATFKKLHLKTLCLLYI